MKGSLGHACMITSPLNGRRAARAEEDAEGVVNQLQAAKRVQGVGTARGAQFLCMVHRSASFVCKLDFAVDA